MLSRKKLGLGIFGLIAAALIYYFTVGSAQVTEEMKMRVNTELNMIEQNGFAVQEREVKAKEEHFILTFDDPEKIVAFFKQQGSEITLENARALTGIKIGVDLKYLNDTYSALSVDMYPLNLPPSVSNAPDLEDADKALIRQMNDMLARKSLLIHVDFNKVLSSFKGYVKDIHEKFKVETDVQIDLEGTTFEGEIQNDRITTLTQAVKILRVVSGDELEVNLNNLKGHSALTGKSLYDSKSAYTVALINISAKEEQNSFSLDVKNMSGENVTSVTNGLASNKMTVKVDKIEMKENSEITKLNNTTFAFNIDNLDMNVLEQLEKIDVSNETERNRLMQALISKGVRMEIPGFEVKKIFYQEKEFDGFSLSSTFQVNKSADMAMIQANPFAALNAVNTKTRIVLSEALFTLIAQQPKAMMLAMLIQPQVVNGKKVYELELKDGTLTVNGKPLM